MNKWYQQFKKDFMQSETNGNYLILDKYFLKVPKDIKVKKLHEYFSIKEKLSFFKIIEDASDQNFDLFAQHCDKDGTFFLRNKAADLFVYKDCERGGIARYLIHKNIDLPFCLYLAIRLASLGHNIHRTDLYKQLFNETREQIISPQEDFDLDKYYNF